MGLHNLAEKVSTITALDGLADPVRAVVKKVAGRGPVKDLLSGTWMGHSLHPMLTDIPIGSFTSAAVLDIVAGPGGENAADLLVALGLVSAIPTAAAGLTDWSDTYGGEQRLGMIHAIANTVGLVLYGTSLIARRRGNRGTGTALGLAGMGAMTVGGYLGGHLSYSRGVGVNNGFVEEPPTDWTAVLDDSALTDGQPVKVEVDRAKILLWRKDGRLLAIGSSCSHSGGPLEEGEIDARACTVTCPWHQGQFRLTDGAVVHGPPTVPQPAYDVRIANAKVEVRARPV